MASRAVNDRAKPLVLVVEDDRGVRESLTMVLEFQGLDVVGVTTGEEGVQVAEADRPDLILLDLNLPGIDGVEVCRQIRGQNPHVAILMLTARDEVRERVRGLDAGADDYLPKPFALDELLARVRALLRSIGRMPAGERLVVADLELEPAARRAWRGGAEIELTKREFDLLELLVRNVGTVLPRAEIESMVWGHDDDLGSNSLEVFVSALRRKTEEGGGARVLHTVRGVGYVVRTES